MRTESAPAVLNIDGLRVMNLSMDESLASIELALIQKHGLFRISFVNADCFNILANDADYQACLQNFDWIFPDGSGVRLAGSVLGQPVRENVNGTDLFPRLCKQLAKSGNSLYLLGGRPEVAKAAADWAQEYAPGLKIAGFHHGYFDQEQLEAVKLEIKLTGTDVLLVGLGAPMQEKWINAHAKDTDVRVAMGVGGLFDFYSGRIPRAPMWMRRLGCEWIFRLIQEPKRLWRRYLIGNVIFMRRIFAARAKARASRSVS